MKLRSQSGISRVLALLGSLVLVAGLPLVVAAPTPQDGADTVAETPPETSTEPPAEEQAEAESETVEEFLEDVLEEVETAKDARVYRGGEVSIMTSIHIPAGSTGSTDSTGAGVPVSMTSCAMATAPASTTPDVAAMIAVATRRLLPCIRAG